MNFVEINKDINSLIDMPERKRLEILEIIRNDTKFLQSKGLMDYSLLLFIET